MESIVTHKVMEWTY